MPIPSRTRLALLRADAALADVHPVGYLAASFVAGLVSIYAALALLTAVFALRAWARRSRSRS